MNWIVFAASLAAVLALGGVAWWMKLGGEDEALKTPDNARAAAEAATLGFDSLDAVIGDDRQGALVLGRGGRVVALKAHGARAAIREVRWSDVRATAQGIRVETGERRFGAVLLPGVDVLDVRRMGEDSHDN